MSSPVLPEVVVVGGGIAGLEVFNGLGKKLDSAPAKSKFNLTLITTRPYYVHLIAAIRTVVSSEGSLEKRSIVPLEGKSILAGANRKLVVGTAVSIEEDEAGQSGSVVLEGGEKVAYSVLVLATGSSWEVGGPWSAFKGSHEDTLKKVEETRDVFAKAEKIVLVGGGAVGYEMAGEIKDSYPSKGVTIVHSGQSLLNETYPAKWRVSVGKKLEARGVTLVLDDKLEDMEIKDGSVTTKKGVKIEADLVVQTRGTSRPNTGYIEQGLGSDALSSNGCVKVLPTLQLLKHPRIFAAGDIVDWNEQKQAMKASFHAGVVVNNVLVHLSLAKKMKPYKTMFEMLTLTNGKNGGSVYMGILWGLTFGDGFASMVKSKGLFIDMYTKNLGIA